MFLSKTNFFSHPTTRLPTGVPAHPFTGPSSFPSAAGQRRSRPKRRRTRRTRTRSGRSPSMSPSLLCHVFLLRVVLAIISAASSQPRKPLGAAHERGFGGSGTNSGRSSCTQRRWLPPRGSPRGDAPVLPRLVTYWPSERSCHGADRRRRYRPRFRPSRGSLPPASHSNETPLISSLFPPTFRSS